MDLSFQSVISLLNPITSTMLTAEEFLRGKGRGAEKKAAVVERTVEHLVAIADAVEGVEIGRYDWVGLLAHTGELREILGRVVDSLVEVFNFLNRFKIVKGVEKTPFVN